jgi:phosphoribosylformylglycinamidine cyclo-ligase
MPKARGPRREKSAPADRLEYVDPVTGSAYARAGVRGQGDALAAVARHLEPTLAYPQHTEVIAGFGAFAAVLRLSPDLALAICTDGVGSKTVIAAQLNLYNTIAIDCVAMNVNDLLCVGARPFALVDYLAVHTLDPDREDALLAGFGAAAKEAGIAIPGGETAQLPSVIGSRGPHEGDGGPHAFDLVGTAIGTVAPDRLILGRDMAPGDAVIGVESSGIHSNGLTLARRALLELGGLSLHDRPAPLGRPLGEELLEPTTIYVRGILDLWDRGIPTRGLAHVTGDGLTNLCRLEAPVGYRLHTLPDPPPIFDLIRSRGDLDDAEMYTVFNMGVGFAVVTEPAMASAAITSLESSGYRAQIIGEVTEEAGVVVLEEPGLRGGLRGGEGFFTPA